MALKAGTAGLGIGISLGGLQRPNTSGERILETYGRDQARRRAAKEDEEAKANKESLVKLTDFKFNDNMLPYYQNKEAQLWTDFMNKFQNDRTKYGDKNATNVAFQDKQKVLMDVAENKSNNDAAQNTLKLSETRYVPNVDILRKNVLNKNATTQDWQPFNDAIFGTSVTEKGAVQAPSYAFPDYNQMAQKYYDKGRTNMSATPQILQVGNEKFSLYPKDNTAERKALAAEISSDPNHRVPFLGMYGKELAAKDPKNYADLFSNDEATRHAAFDKAAYEFASGLLPTPAPEKFSGGIYHAPQNAENKIPSLNVTTSVAEPLRVTTQTASPKKEPKGKEIIVRNADGSKKVDRSDPNNPVFVTKVATGNELQYDNNGQPILETAVLDYPSYNNQPSAPITTTWKTQFGEGNIFKISEPDGDYSKKSSNIPEFKINNVAVRNAYNAKKGLRLVSSGDLDKLKGQTHPIILLEGSTVKAANEEQDKSVAVELTPAIWEKMQKDAGLRISPSAKSTIDGWMDEINKSGGLKPSKNVETASTGKKKIAGF